MPRVLLPFPILFLAFSLSAQTVSITKAEYIDRCNAIWTGQIIATLVGFPFEHMTAAVKDVHDFPRKYTSAPVDDDWYYEMVTIRAFEKYGVTMTAEQLGQAWLENTCGTWGSSKRARELLLKGVKSPETGHPRYNHLWFSIGPQFSADVYGALAPGMPNFAGKMAREFGRLNGYAEGADGAVFMAGMISIAFFEKDPKVVVKKAAQLIHPDSPYRQCLDQVIALAEKGRGAPEIFNAVEDRWHAEYPATNNAVANGGIVAVSIWFGEGDFWKTVNLACSAADFTDADCNAANAAGVVAAMHGTKCLPPKLVADLNDRVLGNKMGDLKIEPSCDEKISDLAVRTAVVGAKLIAANGARASEAALEIDLQEPITQPAELFKLADLMQYFAPDWKLERAGFGGAGGGMSGIRGNTHLDGDVLATYPRDEVRALMLRRTAKLSATPTLSFSAGADNGRAWELEVYVDNKLFEKHLIEGKDPGRTWQDFAIDLKDYAGKDVTLRLFQRVLVPRKTAGNAYWKNLMLK